MRSWLVALRIARREARRSRGRTLLIVAMIAIPVAALSFAAATYDMYRLTPNELVTREMGAADARVTTDPATTASALLTHLPPGSRVSEVWGSSVFLRTAAGIGSVPSYGIDTSDPMTTGLVRIDSGWAPRSDDEVLVSPGLLSRLGIGIGGDIRTGVPGTASIAYPIGTYRIVGVGEVSGSLGQYVLFRPSQLGSQGEWLVKTPGPVTQARASALAAAGIEATSRQLTLHPPPGAVEPLSDPTVAGFSLFGMSTLIGGLGLLEVVLLAGPAFAVGARRRRRELALVATSGGAPSTLRRIVLADGIVGGIAAAVVGVIAGLAAAVAGRPILEEHLAHARFGAYRIYPIAILAVVGIALLTGVLGALVPAVTAGRQDVVAALTGRRGAVKSRAAWLLVGIAGIVAGAGATYAGAGRHDSNIVLAGLVIGEFGIVLCTPTVVGAVAKIGRFLPVAPRIALRDAARRRSAAAPAISAVMAAVAGSVALTVYLGASGDHFASGRPGIPIGSVSVSISADGGSGMTATAQIAAIDAILAKELPGATSVTVTTVDTTKNVVETPLPAAVACPFSVSGAELSAADQRIASADPRCSAENSDLSFAEMSPIVTDDPAVLTATLGLHGTQLATAMAALARGHVVINDPRYVSDGTIAFTTYVQRTDGSTGPAEPHTLAATVVPSGGQRTAYVLAPASARQLNLETTVAGVVATPLAAPTTVQQDALQAALDGQRLSGAYVETGPSHDSRTLAFILAIAAAIIALGAAAIATGLAAVDGRSDLEILGAVGATPRVRRTLALSQSGVIAGLGSLLGAGVGLGAGAAVIFALNRVWAGKWPAPVPYPMEVPWLNLLISVLIVPLVAMLGAGLVTRSRLPIERRAD